MSHQTHFTHPDHIGDLLPAYINGSLNEETRMRVHTHLGSCKACREDLAEWKSIASATRVFAGSLSAQSMQGRAHPSSISNRLNGQPGTFRHVHEPVNVQRPVSRRTLRVAEEKNSMQSLLSIPHGTRQARRGLAARSQWVAAILVFVIAAGSLMMYQGQGGPDDAVRLPAAMQVSPAATAVAFCESTPDALAKLDLSGETTYASAIQPPPGPYEGGYSIESTMLPEGGEPADDQTVAGITRTVERLVSCLNAGDPAGTAALTSEDYWRRKNTIGVEFDRESPRSFVWLTSPTADETILPTVEDARVLPDGRIGAIVRPGFETSSYNYFVFVELDGRWLIDEAAPVVEVAIVELVVTDDGFTPAEVTTHTSFSRLVVTNEGTTTHSVVIPDLMFRIEVSPGATGSENIKHPAGSFAFYSDIPGDDPNLFSGTLIIEGEAQATPASAEPSRASSDTLGVPLASTTITLRPPVEYEPNRVAIIANRDVEITLVNDPSLSTQGADFLTPVAGNEFPGSPANFTIDALGINVDLDPGESETIVVNAPAGVYAYYSGMPGHTEVGMVGTLLVIDTATPAP